MTIFLHMREKAVKTLGPGTRFVIWVSGCHRNCPGCIAPDSHDMTKGVAVDPGALAWEVLLSGAEGLTISGGEPFLQAQALAVMVHIVRQRREMGVIVYTGFTYEELLQMPQAQPLLEQTDLLIDGPYIQELDDGLSLRGSSNQRVIPLTPRYLDALADYGTQKREQEIFRHAGSTHYVGIPTNSTYEA